jgi:hypothetical protein
MEATRDERLRIHAYYEAGLSVKQILDKLPGFTRSPSLFYSTKSNYTPTTKERSEPYFGYTKEKEASSMG